MHVQPDSLTEGQKNKDFASESSHTSKCTNLQKSVLTLMWKRFVYLSRSMKNKKEKNRASDHDSAEEPKKWLFIASNMK